MAVIKLQLFSFIQKITQISYIALPIQTYTMCIEWTESLSCRDDPKISVDASGAEPAAAGGGGGHGQGLG